MSWSWVGFRRAIFGWEKFDTLEEMVLNTNTIDDVISYAKCNFTWEKDRIAEDEWQEPHKAFAALQSPNTPSDCDEFAPVFDFWFKAKGYRSMLVGVWNSKEGHAICVYWDGEGMYWISNWNRPRWEFKNIVDICFDVYSDAIAAKICRWSPQQKKYVYVENIKLKG